jgi:hypothetical protein
MDGDLGKALLLAGLLLAGVGLFLMFGGKAGLPGKIPGDIRIEKESFTFLFPLGTCLLVSVLLSLLLWLFKR